MSKNIKRTIAFILSINIASMIGSSTNINIFLDSAKASKYDDPLLSELKISGYDLDFDQERFSYKLKVDKDVDKITIKAKPNDSKYITNINLDEAKEDDNYKVDVDLKQGKNIIPIRVKDDKHDLKTYYEIEVIRGSIDDGDDLDENDIYLDNITLSEGNMNFSSKMTDYKVYLKERINYLDIKAKPMDLDEDYVEIDGEDVDENDDFEQTVTLKEGKNKIIIRVENSEKSKKYTLTIYNGVEPPTNENNEKKDDNILKQDSNIKDEPQYKNKWIMDQGIWIYYGNDGQILRNQWYTDANTGKTYFFNENGVMKTGWLYNNNNWYYLNPDGSRHSGWCFIMGLWYHFDKQGIMRTGWFNDDDGKWYYFDENGAMLENTTIDGYKLDSSGVWVK